MAVSSANVPDVCTRSSLSLCIVDVVTLAWFPRTIVHHGTRCTAVAARSHMHRPRPRFPECMASCMSLAGHAVVSLSSPHAARLSRCLSARCNTSGRLPRSLSPPFTPSAGQPITVPATRSWRPAGLLLVPPRLSAVQDGQKTGAWEFGMRLEKVWLTCCAGADDDAWLFCPVRDVDATSRPRAGAHTGQRNLAQRRRGHFPRLGVFQRTPWTAVTREPDDSTWHLCSHHRHSMDVAVRHIFPDAEEH